MSDAVRTNLTRVTAADLADAIAQGEVTALEVTNEHLERIDEVDPAIHAFLHVDYDGARAQAQAVDEKRAAGEDLGPLAGVPVALKDVFTQVGIPTTAGCECWRAGGRHMTPVSSIDCAAPIASFSAKPTWTSSRWGPPRSIPATDPPVTRGISNESLAAPEVDPPQPSPRLRRRWASERTPAVRFVSPPR